MRLHCVVLLPAWVALEKSGPGPSLKLVLGTEHSSDQTTNKMKSKNLEKKMCFRCVLAFFPLFLCCVGVFSNCHELFGACEEMEDPSRRALLSVVAGGLAVAGVNAALKASDERFAAFGLLAQP